MLPGLGFFGGGGGGGNGEGGQFWGGDFRAYTNVPMYTTVQCIYAEQLDE